MVNSVTIIVGGVGTNSDYFKSYAKTYIWTHSCVVYELKPNVSLEDQALKIVNNISKYFTHHHVHCVGFSLGCMLLMKVLETPSICDKVTFINPCHLALDRHYNKTKRWYKILWKMPLCIQKLYLMYYERYVEPNLEEPEYHMRNLLSKPFEHWDGIIQTIGHSMSWCELIKNCSFERRIKIIHVNKDRYVNFGHLLALEYNDRFFCKVVEGQHHLFHKNADQLYICT